MKGTNNPSAAKTPRKKIIAWLPLLAAVVALVTFFSARGSQTEEWDGIKLTAPVESARTLEDQNEALFETEEPALVQAAIAGKASSVSERTLELTDGSITVRYRG